MRKVIGYGISIKAQGDEESIGFYNTAEEAAAILPTLVLEYMDRIHYHICDYSDEQYEDMFYRCRYWSFTNCPPAHNENVHTGECIHIIQEELVKHFLENKYYEPCMYFKFKLIEIRAI